MLKILVIAVSVVAGLLVLAALFVVVLIPGQVAWALLRPAVLGDPELEVASANDALPLSFDLRIRGVWSATLQEIILNRAFALEIGATPPEGFSEAAPEVPNRDDFEPDLDELSAAAERAGLEVTDEMLEEEATRQYADAISSTEELHRESLVWSGRRKLRLFRTTRLVIPARLQPGTRGTITFSCRHRIGISGESHFSADHEVEVSTEDARGQQPERPV